MTIILIGFVIAAYIAIGAFLSGFYDEGDHMGLWIMFWPIVVTLYLVVKCVERVSEFGEDAAEWLEDRRDELS